MKSLMNDVGRSAEIVNVLDNRVCPRTLNLECAPGTAEGPMEDVLVRDGDRTSLSLILPVNRDRKYTLKTSFISISYFTILIFKFLK